MASEGGHPVSATRLYLGNLPSNATKVDVEKHFSKHGGKVREIKLMQGFGFIEYLNPIDAQEVVPGKFDPNANEAASPVHLLTSLFCVFIAFHGHEFMGSRMVVEFATGGRSRQPNAHFDRPPPRPRRTRFRMRIENLPVDTSWQDLKDFARQSDLDVVYSDVSRDRDGRGYAEYDTLADLHSAVKKLDQSEFKEHIVTCIADVSDHPQDERAFNSRYRSRSPRPSARRRYPPLPADDYDHRNSRAPPRDYSPHREYRHRSPPPPRSYHDGPARGRYDRSRDEPRYPDDGYTPARPYDEPYGPPRGAPQGSYNDPYPSTSRGHDHGHTGHGHGHGHGHGSYSTGGSGRAPYDDARGGYDGPPRGGRRSPPGRPPYDGGSGYRSRQW